MDIAGLPMMRRPFSPISSTDSSRSNVTSVLDELNRKQQHSEMVQKTNSNTTPLSTPVKTIPIPYVDEENRTPMAMPIPIPSTPSTVSIPMQTAITPAPLTVVPYNAKAVEEMTEEIEYSFEERRAGFVLPRSHMKTLMQV